MDEYLEEEDTVEDQEAELCESRADGNDLDKLLGAIRQTAVEENELPDDVEGEDMTMPEAPDPDSHLCEGETLKGLTSDILNSEEEGFQEAPELSRPTAAGFPKTLSDALFLRCNHLNIFPTKESKSRFPCSIDCARRSFHLTFVNFPN